MQRLVISASAVEQGDIVLTADILEPSCVYADLVWSSWTDEESDWHYLVTETDRFRFAPDQNVTVLRGVKL